MTSWLQDQAQHDALRERAEEAERKLAKALADRDHYRDAWLSRGRDLNALYDVINEVAGDQRTLDPVSDLRALKANYEAWQQAGRLHSA